MTISNNPPPVEVHGMGINDLYDEAKNFLDGEPIASQEQADSIGKLLGLIRDAEKAAEAQRKEEAKPFDDGKKAVQAAWKPLLDKCQLASEACKKTLAPWLKKLDDEQRAAAKKAREEAEEAARKAHQAMTSARDDDLEGQQIAREMQEHAEAAHKLASRADKAKANVAGTGRAIGLRSYFHAEIVDRRALLNHYAKTRPDDLEAWLQDQAQRDVSAGVRHIPGVNVTEERRAV